MWRRGGAGHTGFNRQVRASLLEIHPNLITRDLRIVDAHKRLFSLEISNESNGRGLASVASISLESKAKDRNTLFQKLFFS